MGDEMLGGWGKLHNEDLHNLYSSPNIIRMIKTRRMRWAGHEVRMVRRGIHIGKRPLGKLKRGWEDNVKINFRNIGSYCPH
jgi:hypothetical protein